MNALRDILIISFCVILIASGLLFSFTPTQQQDITVNGQPLTEYHYVTVVFWNLNEFNAAFWIDYGLLMKNNIKTLNELRRQEVAGSNGETVTEITKMNVYNFMRRNGWARTCEPCEAEKDVLGNSSLYCIFEKQ